MPYNNISSSISDYGSDTGSYSLTYETYQGAIGVTVDETPIDAASIWVDSLKNGTAWASASGASVTTITYTFAAGPGGEVTGSEWDAASQAAFEHAILQYEAIANIDFVYVADVQDANIAWWLGSDADFDEASLGWHYPPVPGSIASSGAFNIDALGWTAEGLAPGGYGYVTVIHELGHALGLAHPHDAAVPFPGVTSPLDDYGDFQLNQGIWTTMSYNSGWPSKIPPTDTTAGYEGSPMALDVAAIQEIYGINENYETGDNVYLLSDVLNQAWICVWDAGGIDMLSGEGLSDDLLIDLRYATLDDANAGGFVSCAISYDSFLPKRVGGYTIANGVTIENAKGGNGDDLIVGNDSANVLYGLGGNDTFLGSRGHDTIYGGEGADTVSYAGNFSSYSIVEHSDYVLVSGSDFVDQLEGIEYLTFDDFQYRVEGAGNSAPVAAVYTKSVAEDSYVSGTVVATDVDNYPEELVYSLQPGDGPLHGSIVMDASGAYTYTPNADFNGEDSFTYTVTDSNGASDTAVVTIIVSAVDDAPVAQDTSREATEANDASGVIVGQLAATDLDNDHADITYALNAEAPAGLTLNADGSYTFDPSVASYNSLGEGEQQVVSVGYTATSNGLTDTSVITVTVTGTNDAPVAAMSSKGVAEDGSVFGVVVATDVDSNAAGFVYFVEAGDGPANGVLNIDSNGAYTYTPNADFNGEDSFTYTVTDSNGGTDTAVVTITVSAVDDAPAAQDATAAVAEDATLYGQLSATDVDNNDADITYALNQSVAGLTLNDDGSWEFDAGNDAYQALAAGETNVVQTTYTPTSNGKSDSGVITITVTGTNDAPVATVSILSGPENTDIRAPLSFTQFEC